MSRLQAGARHPVRFSLNGKPCAGDAEPRLLLTDFLRHQIGMTGVHVGCEHGVCGACTVLMSLDCFLRDHPRPDEAAIRDFLSGHLCRCTGYTPIVRAALEAAAEMAGDVSGEKSDA